MRPLQVYLDSSDFSVFGDALAGIGPPQMKVLAESLKTLSRSGEVEFRVSAMHVLEAAPVADEHVSLARRRGIAMEYLGARHALDHWDKLPVLDVLAHLSGDLAPFPRDRNQYHGRNDDGHWFPPYDKEMHELQNDLRGFFRDPLSVVMEREPELALGRALRRRAAREGKSGRAAKAIAADMMESKDVILQKVRTMFPVSPSNERVWIQYLVDRASPAVVSKALRDDLGNLGEVMLWLAPSSRALSALPKWLRTSSEMFSANYENNRNAVDGQSIAFESRWGREALASSWKGAKVGSIDQHQQRAVETLKQKVIEDQAWLAREGFSIEDAVVAIQQEGISVAPSRVAFELAVALNMKKNLSPLEPRRNKDKVGSDVGDVMHATYMPYVDVMRIDGFAAQYMGPIAKEFGTTIVSRRDDLLPTIQARLSSRMTVPRA